MKPKMLVFDESFSYATPWRELYDPVGADKRYSLLENIKKADCVLFTGGSDVSPWMYGQKKLITTFTHEERDRLEEVVFKLCIDHKRPTLGICRGAQLACVMAGGELIQDVHGHTGGHDMTTSDGVVLHTSSLHHQMMLLGDTPHKLLAWSNKRSSHYLVGPSVAYEGVLEPIKLETAYADGKEPEVVYFPEINSLGIQGHPEMLYEERDKETLQWFRAQVKEFLL